jgi:hypothetical protein
MYIYNLFMYKLENINIFLSVDLFFYYYLYLRLIILYVAQFVAFVLPSTGYKKQFTIAILCVYHRFLFNNFYLPVSAKMNVIAIENIIKVNMQSTIYIKKKFNK